MTTHFVTWLWHGWRDIYTRRDVATWARQLIRFGDLPTDSRLLLITDYAQDWHSLELARLGVEEAPLWPELVGLPSFRKGQPNCFRRLKIADPDTQESLGIKPGDIIVSSDLDSCWLGSVRPLLRTLQPTRQGAVTIPGADFAAQGGRVSRIHGALTALRAGTHTHLWRDFDPRVSPLTMRQGVDELHGKGRPVGSDQAWMSLTMPTVPLWGPQDGVFAWGRHAHLVKADTPQVYWSFAGPQKPRGQMVKEITPWLYDHYLAAWDAYS